MTKASRFLAQLWAFIQPPAGRDSRRLVSLLLTLVGLTYVFGVTPIVPSGFADASAIDAPLWLVGIAMVVTGLGTLATSNKRTTTPGRLWAAFAVGVCCYLVGYYSARITSILLFGVIGWGFYGEIMLVREPCIKDGGNNNVAPKHY